MATLYWLGGVRNCQRLDILEGFASKLWTSCTGKKRKSMWSNDELHRRYQAYLDRVEQEIDEGRRAEGERIQSFEEFENGYENKGEQR